MQRLTMTRRDRRGRFLEGKPGPPPGTKHKIPMTLEECILEAAASETSPESLKFIGRRALSEGPTMWR